MRLKKIALGSTVIMLLALLVPMVFANGNGGPGYTPGFWKHNIGVALGENPGRYSAFSDGTKLTELMLEGYADIVGVDLEEAYEALSAKGPGMNTVRTDMANAFNAAAGLGPYVDTD